MFDRESRKFTENLFFEKGETVAVVTIQKGKEFLDYLVPKGGVATGAIVKVPIRNRIVLGVVWAKGLFSQTPYKKREISKVVNLPRLNVNVLDFLLSSSEYNIFSLNIAIRLCLNPSLNLEIPNSSYYYEMGDQKIQIHTSKRKRVLDVLSSKGKQPISKLQLRTKAQVSESVLRNLEEKGVIKKLLAKKTNDFSTIETSFSSTLSKAQKEISDQVRSQIKSKSYSTIMLKGVTGSGKTEIYMDAIAEAISKGAQVLVLFPEINLSTTFVERLKQRFKSGFAEWHSSILKKEKRKTLIGVLDGSLKLVFGTRSAVFLPFNKLGLIVVDEEHDTSYKQEEGTRYHARDMAVLKGFYSNAAVLLVSATPSMETWVNTLQNKYRSEVLSERFGNATMPKVSLIDLGGRVHQQNHWLSKEIIEKISFCLSNKTQSLLFLNRRGYSPLLICEKCFQMLSCKNCDAKLAEHKLYNALLCHLCGTKYDIPKTCPSCHNQSSFIPVGPGIEKIEEETRRLFPSAKIEVLSSDHYQTPTDLKGCFQRIISGEVDIIIGTQVISKGHNFPLLSFVGIIDVDLALRGGDIRAAENTFQLLRQVIGRAGRFNTDGEAYIQTYFPKDPVMKAICSNNDEEFVMSQKNLREAAKVPPFGRMVALLISGVKHETAMSFAKYLVTQIFFLKDYGVEIFGPADARISKMRKKFRIRVLLKSSKNVAIQRLLKNALQKVRPPSGITLIIDVDPINFY